MSINNGKDLLRSELFDTIYYFELWLQNNGLVITKFTSDINPITITLPQLAEKYTREVHPQ